MKGLELHRLFFEECARPLLEQAFPRELPLMAIASVGFGSDRIGADDEFSHDHAWEPGLQVFSDRLDVPTLETIERCLYEKLPWEFRGHRRTDTPHSINGIRAWTIDEFFTCMTSYARPPRDDLGWLRIPEEALYHATNGQVFHDPAGDLTRRREAFGQYPPNVWLLRFSAKAFRADVMRYNVERAVRHGERIAAEILLADGLREVMHLAHLANRRYAPYDRWLHWSFRRLPVLAPQIDPLMSRIYATWDWPERQRLYVEILKLCGKWTGEEGLSTGGESWWKEVREGLTSPLKDFFPTWLGAEYRFASLFSLGGDWRRLLGLEAEAWDRGT